MGNNNNLIGNTTQQQSGGGMWWQQQQPQHQYFNPYMPSQQIIVRNNQNQFLKCRPVSSQDEARACQIDLDGSLWVFTDVSNGKIYTKQIRNDGTASFNVYVYSPPQEPEPVNNFNNYVTKDELKRAMDDLMTTLTNQQNKNNAIVNF